MAEYGEGIEYIIPKKLVNEYLLERIKIDNLKDTIYKNQQDEKFMKKENAEEQLDRLRTELESEEESHWKRWEIYKYTIGQQLYVIEQ
jgi:hypothetical protein